MFLHSAHQGVTSMTARAETTVFWPGITSTIMSTRKNCNHCNRMAPSQPSVPPYPPVQPAYPFQCICADYFHYKGLNYLFVVDRYSNWPIIERAHDGSKGLINSLRQIFTTFGIPDECATDGGPEFTYPRQHANSFVTGEYTTAYPPSPSPTPTAEQRLPSKQ